MVNAASYAPLISPGSFVTIYGQNLADAAASWDSAITDGKTLPTSLGGVQVQIHGKRAFVDYVAPGQINVLAPPDSTTGLVDIDVATNHGTATATVSLGAVSPAFLRTPCKGNYTRWRSSPMRMSRLRGRSPAGASRPATAGDYVTLTPTAPATPAIQSGR